MQIEPTTIWSNGQQKTATEFNLKIVHDDLHASATLHFELLEAVAIDEDNTRLEPIVSGNLVIDGQDYIDWCAVPDINLWVYNWALGLLNLTAV